MWVHMFPHSIRTNIFAGKVKEEDMADGKKTTAKKATVAKRAPAKKATVAKRAPARKAPAAKNAAKKKATPAAIKRRLLMRGGGCSSSYDATGNFQGVNTAQYVAGPTLSSLSMPVMNNCGLNITTNVIPIRGSDTVHFAENIATPGAPFSVGGGIRRRR